MQTYYPNFKDYKFIILKDEKLWVYLKLDTPTYTLVLPSTGEEIKYRPFLVKEQKLLMMSEESEEDNKCMETMSEC